MSLPPDEAFRRYQGMVPAVEDMERQKRNTTPQAGNGSAASADGSLRSGREGEAPSYRHGTCGSWSEDADYIAQKLEQRAAAFKEHRRYDYASGDAAMDREAAQLLRSAIAAGEKK